MFVISINVQTLSWAPAYINPIKCHIKLEPVPRREHITASSRRSEWDYVEPNHCIPHVQTFKPFKEVFTLLFEPNISCSFVQFN